MTGLAALWMPILLAAVILFFASFVIHMVLPWHKGDYRAVAREDDVMAALRPFAIAPGDYMIPRPRDPKDMQSPEYKAKMQAGPVLIATVLPSGQTGMGGYLAKWFIFLVVVNVFIAYAVGLVLPAGSDYMHVFRVTGAVAFLAHAAGLWPQSIWYRRNVGTTLRSTVDALAYALLTAGTFGWLWPQ